MAMRSGEMNNWCCKVTLLLELTESEKMIQMAMCSTKSARYIPTLNLDALGSSNLVALCTASSGDQEL